MVNSRKRKKRLQKFKLWRYANQVTRCQECGKKLRTVTHHKLCNHCWNEKHGVGVSKWLKLQETIGLQYGIDE